LTSDAEDDDKEDGGLNQTAEPAHVYLPGVHPGIHSLTKQLDIGEVVEAMLEAKGRFEWPDHGNLLEIPDGLHSNVHFCIADQRNVQHHYEGGALNPDNYGLNLKKAAYTRRIYIARPKTGGPWRTHPANAMEDKKSVLNSPSFKEQNNILLVNVCPRLSQDGKLKRVITRFRSAPGMEELENGVHVQYIGETNVEPILHGNAKRSNRPYVCLTSSARLSLADHLRATEGNARQAFLRSARLDPHAAKAGNLEQVKYMKRRLLKEQQGDDGMDKGDSDLSQDILNCMIRMHKSTPEAPRWNNVKLMQCDDNNEVCLSINYLIQLSCKFLPACGLTWVNPQHTPQKIIILFINYYRLAD
jgi:hypothetical protein